MSEFLDILTHGRRLQGAVKELSIEELEQVQEKLSGIIEKRKEKLLLLTRYALSQQKKF